MPQIRIVHQDGTEHVLPHVEDEVEEHFDRLWNATLTTTRDAARDVAFDEADDYVYLDSEDDSRDFGGVLRDVDVGEATVDLVVDSFERLAIDAEPTGAGVRWQGVTDQAVITSSIADVPDLTQGEVQHLKSGLSFLFNRATQAKRIRTVMDATGGWARYNADRSVDYLSRSGATRDEILAPSRQTIVDSITVNRKGGEDKATHLVMLGAGEGTHQKEAVVVDPEFDPAVDRERWRVYSNKDFTDEATLREHGEELIEEFRTEWIEAKATLRNIDPPRLGDTFPVEHPESGLDRRLKVVRIVRKRDEDGRRWDVDLSSRQLTRETDAQKARKDVERYNKAVQGVAVPINAGGGEQKVNGQSNYEMRLYYPSEVEYEHRLNVRVMGLPYRVDSAGAASGGGTIVTSKAGGTNDDTTQSGGGAVVSSADNSNFSNIVDTATFSPDGIGWSGGPLSDFEVLSLSISSDTSLVIGHLSVNLTSIGGVSDPEFDLWLEDGAGNRYPEGGVNVGLSDLGSGTAVGMYAQNANGETVRLMVSETTSSTDGFMYAGGAIQAVGRHVHNVDIPSHAHQFDWRHFHDIEIPSHVHDPEPGIIESFNGTRYYPENCNVIINGQSQGTAFGDGTGRFEESVEVLGELTPGEVNRIEVTSDSLGRVMTFLEGDCYREIIGEG